MCSYLEESNQKIKLIDMYKIERNRRLSDRYSSCLLTAKFVVLKILTISALLYGSYPMIINMLINITLVTFKFHKLVLIVDQLFYLT